MDTLGLLSERGMALSSTISASGHMLAISAGVSNQLGYDPDYLRDQPIELIYTAESVRTVQHLFANPPADERVHSLELTLMRHNGGLVPVVASGILEWRSIQPARLHLIEMPLGPLGRRVQELQNANEVMSQMLLKIGRAHV